MELQHYKTWNSLVFCFRRSRPPLRVCAVSTRFPGYDLDLRSLHGVPELQTKTKLLYRSINDHSLLSFRPGISTLFCVRGNCAGDLVAAYSISLMGEFSLAFNGALSCMEPETVAARPSLGPAA